MRAANAKATTSRAARSKRIRQAKPTDAMPSHGMILAALTLTQRRLQDFPQLDHQSVMAEALIRARKMSHAELATAILTEARRHECGLA